jgi:large subunit ribosomal protein L17
MRHRVKNQRVGHNSPLSNSILRNLATSIVLYEKVQTTKLRAKRIRPVLEKLITSAKKQTPLNAIRTLNAYFLDPKAGEKVMKEILKRYEGRTSGFLRLVPLGHRAGDAAEMMQVELV